MHENYDVPCDAPISCIGDVKRIEERIEEYLGLTPGDVVILNFRLYDALPDAAPPSPGAPGPDLELSARVTVPPGREIEGEGRDGG